MINKFWLILVLLVLSACLLTGRGVVAQSDLTISKLQAAENAVELAFNVVLDAEKEGVNVTVLIGRLNVATDLLVRAEMAFRVGDVSGALEKAAGVFAIATEVETDAVSAMGFEYFFERYNAGWSIAIISIVAGFTFVLLMLIIWRWFKQNYIKGLRDSKPEVI